MPWHLLGVFFVSEGISCSYKAHTYRCFATNKGCPVLQKSMEALSYVFVPH